MPQVTAIMSVPGPEITGLCLTPDESYLIITEDTTASVYRSRGETRAMRTTAENDRQHWRHPWLA